MRIAGSVLVSGLLKAGHGGASTAPRSVAEVHEDRHRTRRVDECVLPDSYQDSRHQALGQRLEAERDRRTGRRSPTVTAVIDGERDRSEIAAVRRHCVAGVSQIELHEHTGVAGEQPVRNVRRHRSITPPLSSPSGPWFSSPIIATQSGTGVAGNRRVRSRSGGLGRSCIGWPNRVWSIPTVTWGDRRPSWNRPGRARQRRGVAGSSASSTSDGAQPLWRSGQVTAGSLVRSRI